MTDNLTRNEIAESMFHEIGLSKSECLIFVDTIINILTNAIIEDKVVKIPNFGTFKVRFKKERAGRNPKTKEPAIISSRNVITFKVSQQLIRKLNE